MCCSPAPTLAVREGGREREGRERTSRVKNCWHVKIQTKPLRGKRTYAVAKLNTDMKDSL